MSLCYKDWPMGGRLKCLKGSGHTMNFTQSPVNIIALTVHLKSGGNITKEVKPTNIVKPRSPRVQNVTFNLESNQAVIYIQTPYTHNDYLKVENQLFQLHISTAGSEMTQNLSGSDNIKISMDHLRRNAQYFVSVQAIPVGSSLHGSWSEWSEAFTFITPDEDHDEVTNSQKVYILIVCLISLVVVTSSVVFLSKNKIIAYMWPSIPHPKHTLVQICKPNKGLLLNLKPEVFSALKVYPMEETEEDQGEDTQPSVNALAADGTQSNNPSSTQSSDCRSTTSISTEELELSTLLSRSSSNGEDSLQSTSPSPINVLMLCEVPIPRPEGRSGGNQVELFGLGQQEEAYVTMSSFYQIK
ncbi:interleukin-7 receptor subunit alpha isoform X2 [Channa argus]